MTYTVTAGNDSAVCLWETDPIKAKLQEVRLVTETIKGSVPMFREFGCLDPEVLDKPMPVAKIMMIGEVREAIETWEPGAAVKSGGFAEGALEPGKLIPAVEVEIVAEG